MANIPDNIVSLMAVDTAGNVVNLDIFSLGIISAPESMGSARVGAEVQQEEQKQQIPQVINNEVITSLQIDAEPNYVPIVNSDQQNLVNSIIYQKGKKLGILKKNPNYAVDLFAGSFNIDNSKSISNAYRINKLSVAAVDDVTDPNDVTLVLGDDLILKTTSVFNLVIRDEILITPVNENRILVVDDFGRVDAVPDIYLETINGLSYKDQSISLTTGASYNDLTIEDVDDNVNKISKHIIHVPTASRTKRGVVSALDYAKFDDKQDAITLTANRVVISDSNGKITQSTISNTILGYLSNVTSDIQAQIDAKFTLPAFVSGSVIFSNGSSLAQDNANFSYDDANNRLYVSNLYAPIIGNPAGVSAQNSWTFASNVTLANGVIPSADQHLVTKKYVDDIALTGLRLGAEVKTVAISNVTLSGNQTINGYTTTTGDRVLLVGQTNATENGVYITSSGGWTRATDSDSDAELRGYQYLVSSGNEAGARYGNTNTTTISIGSTNITYQKISGQETDPIFTASPAATITNTDKANWNTAYSRNLPDNSMSISGTTTKTITLTRQNNTTISASFTESVHSVSGTTNRITVGTAPNYVVDISANYIGQSSITTVGTISSGIWQGSQIADAYIASAATWNAKQNAITGAASTVTTSNLTANRAVVSDASGKIAVSVVTSTEIGYLSGVTSSLQTQLNAKQGNLTLTTSGTSGAATLIGNTLNIPNYQSGVTSFNSRSGAVVPQEGDYTLTQLGGVTITTPATGNYLRYNGTEWVNSSLVSGDVSTALGYTPLQSESDTLQSVTSRGSTTSTSITANAFFEGSDARFKDVKSIDPIVDLSKLKVVAYKRNDVLTDDLRYGYLAQDVNEIEPSLVKTENDRLYINYSDIHTLKIAQLEREVAELKKMLGI